MSSASVCVESVSHAHSEHRIPADTFLPAELNLRITSASFKLPYPGMEFTS